jgi:hypothetical protein
VGDLDHHAQRRAGPVLAGDLEHRAEFADIVARESRTRCPALVIVAVMTGFDVNCITSAGFSDV